MSVCFHLSGSQGVRMNAVEISIGRASIHAITQLIVDRFGPEQIILFGSHARGDVGPHSDLDLMVVLRADEVSPQSGVRIRRAIAERYILPVDVIVRSPEVLAVYRNDPTSLVHKVLEEGKVLYERRAA